MTKLNFWKRIHQSEEAASLLELGFVLPIFLMLLLGAFDFSYVYYGRSVVIGAVQAAARDATLQSNNTDQSTIDAKVLARIKSVNPGATWKELPSRRSYREFSDVGKPEPFEDADGDTFCNNNENYTDVNNDTHWSSDVGATNQGRASDVVVYTVKVNYPRIFNIAGFLNIPNVAVIETSTVLRNQPFNTNVVNPVTRKCS